MTAGIRAPESSVLTNGFCTNEAVIEKAQSSNLDSHELRRVASNPTTLHSGFAPSFHPFDLPKAYKPSSPDFLTNMSFDFVPSPDGLSIFPRLRPPISISL